MLFAAFEKTNGEELWATDGTPAGTVLFKDLSPGGPTQTSKVNSMTDVRGTLYFNANDGAGEGVWVRDPGRPAPTPLASEVRWYCGRVPSDSRRSGTAASN